MVSFDSTQAVQADRIRIWSGPYEGAVTELTLTDSSDTPVAQNDTVVYNRFHETGLILGAVAFAGTIADVYFLDGIASTDPADFVDNPSTDARPKAYTGSFGNLGYHLDFANSADLGNDVSGNNNDFTTLGAPAYVDPYLEQGSAVDADLAATESTDTASFDIAAAHTASLAATEGADAASFSASIVRFASFAATEAADTASLDIAAAHTSDLAATESSDVALILLFDGVAVALGATEGADIAAFDVGLEDPVSVALAATEQPDRAAFSDFEPFVVAPSYGYWLKTKNRNKPQAPKLPEPMHAGEVVIDEAVIRQMEEERLAAFVLEQKKAALERIDDLRAYAPAEKKPTRAARLGRKTEPEETARRFTTLKREATEPAPQVKTRSTIDLNRFDVIETTPEVRARVINLFRPPEPEPLTEPVKGSVTVRTLGPRRAPEPEIRKARTISLRRSNGRHTGEMQWH
jgi:hypothetical protein